MASSTKPASKINQSSLKIPSAPYITGPGSYNRESGNKTLIFVAIMIVIIALLVITILYLMHRKSSVMIQGATIEKQEQTR